MSAQAGKTVQVIGGGFAGLCAAYFLARQGHHVHLVENATRRGGLLRTLDTPYGLVETAANALLSNELVEETAAELGVTLIPTRPTAKKRFILREGKLRRFPLKGPAAMRFLTRTAPRFLFARQSLSPQPGESVRNWGERCLGEDATNYLLIPGLSGIYAGEPTALSASLILGRFFAPKKNRVRPGRLRGSVAPKNGMEELTLAMHRYLEQEGAEFKTEATPNLPTIVALPPPAAAAFLESRAPNLSASLQRIEMVSLLSVTVFLPESATGIDGFGLLFPRSEGYRVLGILANDRIFAGRAKPGYRSETWIFGGATDPEVLNLSDAAVKELISAERERLFGPAKIEEYSIHRWPRAIPHYNLQLEAELNHLKAQNFSESNYTLFGTYLGDLGLARVLARAEALSRKF